jgi:hypothetical protein
MDLKFESFWWFQLDFSVFNRGSGMVIPTDRSAVAGGKYLCRVKVGIEEDVAFQATPKKRILFR